MAAVNENRRILVRQFCMTDDTRPAGHFKHELFQQWRGSAMRGNPPGIGALAHAALRHVSICDRRRMRAGMSPSARRNARKRDDRCMLWRFADRHRMIWGIPSPGTAS